MSPGGLAAALASAASCLLSASAFGYVRNHVDPNDSSTPCLYWSRRTVPFALNARGLAGAPSEDPVFKALRASFQSWTDVDCSDFAYQDAGLTDSVEIGFNKALLDQPFLVDEIPPQDTVIFRARHCSDVVPAGDDCLLAQDNDCASRFDCWDYGSSVIALTTTTYNFQNGQIFDADIELNQADFTFTAFDPPTPACLPPPAPQDGGCISSDIQNTVTHEAGHMLGLGHSPVPTATMFASAVTGEIEKRTLDPDDIQGLCAIYPTGQPPVTCNEPPPPPASCGCGLAGGADALGLAFVLLTLASRRPRG